MNPFTHPPAVGADTAEGGFTLLEGLVAIALLAGTMAAIFALVGNLLNSANKVAQSNRTALISENALEAMSIINPMTQPTGQIDLGEYTVKWKSEARTPISDGAGYPLGTSLYQLAFYDSAVRVEEQGSGVPLTEFKLRQVGYRRVREPPSPLDVPGLSARTR